MEQSTRRATVASIVLGCVVGQSFGRFTFGLLLPAVKEDLKISYGLVGWLGTINLAAYLVGSLATSAASLRIPAHRIVKAGITLAAVGVGVLAIAPSTPVLLLGMAMAGLGGAASWVPAPVVIASAFPPERRGFAMGMSSAGIGSGIVLATAMTAVLRALVDDPGAWRPIWGVEAVVGAVIALYAIRSLQPVPVTPGKPPSISVLRQVPRWWAPTLAYVLFGIGYVMFTVFVVAALERRGFARSHASQVFACLGLGNAIGGMSIGPLSDRIGRRATMVGSFVASGLPCFVVLAGHEPLVSITTLVFGMAMSGAAVSIGAYIGDHTRPQDFSAAFGVATVCFGLAQAIGPRLGGWMVDRYGDFDQVFVVAGTAWLVGAVLASLSAGPRTTSSATAD